MMLLELVRTTTETFETYICSEQFNYVLVKFSRPSSYVERHSISIYSCRKTTDKTQLIHE